MQVAVQVPNIVMLKELIGLNLPATQGPVESPHHQYGLHGGAHCQADKPAAAETDPDRQILPARYCADEGDVAGPPTVGGC